MIKKIMLTGAMGLILFASFAARAEFPCSDPVPTRSGPVQGAQDSNNPAACAWKGIPFAAPPVGELRWQPPQPVLPWSGARRADKFGDRCMQKGIMALEGVMSEAGMSEDCLYLNVWRPKKEGTFPVMVWIHGGGYYGGAASTAFYWGDRLAVAGDLVVVSTNYRLNVFGFFAHPALREEDPHRSSGSQGTLDQVAALQWVQDNIHNFGGDPNNVTIFGESAGGWSICTMVATPLAQGLFKGAILESGGCKQSQDLEKGYATARKISENLDCPAGDLECLRRLPAEKVLKKGFAGGMGNLEFMPHHDGYALFDTPLAMIRSGNYNHAAFMAGSTRDEFGKALKLRRDVKKIKPEDYERQLVERFEFSPEEAKTLVQLYPLDQFGNRPVEAYGRMFGADMALACPTYAGLLAAAERQSGTYYYRFDYLGMKYSQYTGAAHAFEIPFIFDSLDRPPTSLFYNRHNLGEAKALSRIIQGYWINFAKTGNPNGTGLPEWPEFDPERQRVQILNTDTHAEPADISPRCSFWEEHSKEIDLGF
ncbi:MAG: hypothetical protein A2V67_14680 [Deltaproteobacteria bacterium RBG_13_61_14]|nr:MAG: hypothetical protein A2V67_14680 [Deltaproteobacteria bacterium RBG_13_61_14]